MHPRITSRGERRPLSGPPLTHPGRARLPLRAVSRHDEEEHGQHGDPGEREADQRRAPEAAVVTRGSGGRRRAEGTAGRALEVRLGRRRHRRLVRGVFLRRRRGSVLRLICSLRRGPIGRRWGSWRLGIGGRFRRRVQWWNTLVNAGPRGDTSFPKITSETSEQRDSYRHRAVFRIFFRASEGAGTIASDGRDKPLLPGPGAPPHRQVGGASLDPLARP